MAFISNTVLSCFLAIRPPSFKAFMESMIKSINQYRQMDPRGVPADSSLYLALSAALILYAYAGYRLGRK